MIYRVKVHLIAYFLFILVVYCILDKIWSSSNSQQNRLQVQYTPCNCEQAGSTPSIVVPSVSKITLHESLHTKLNDSLCPTCQVFDLTKNNSFEVDCIQMRFQPVTPICVYKIEEDIYVSGSLRSRGTWEASYVSTFQKWLDKNKTIGVIDIGANLGVYSLVAAAMGHKVLAVEPSIENIKRFHKAVKLGELEDKITLLQNAVSDNRGFAKIIYSKTNQGDTRMVAQSNGTEIKDEASYSDEYVFTKMITMNDLLNFCDFQKAIMKIDIEGFEHRAFVKADSMFDNINIIYVLMEWAAMTQKAKQKPVDADEIQLVEKMIHFFNRRGYIPHDWNFKVLEEEKWREWPNDVVWVKPES